SSATVKAGTAGVSAVSYSTGSSPSSPEGAALPGAGVAAGAGEAASDVWVELASGAGAVVWQPEHTASIAPAKSRQVMRFFIGNTPPYSVVQAGKGALRRRSGIPW